MPVADLGAIILWVADWAKNKNKDQHVLVALFVPFANTSKLWDYATTNHASFEE
jgi:hypothetical protein